MHALKNSLFVLGILFSVSSIAQTDLTVPQTQVPMITKISASWCPYCGTWGWDFMEALMEDNSNFSNLITAHYSGDYRSTEAAQMTSNFGAFGQPEFFFNSDRISVNASTTNQMRTEVKAMIAQKREESPVVQTGLLAGPNNGQFNVVTKTRFFQNTSGEFYLGLYVVEKSFSGPQAGRQTTALHKNVLRAGLSDNTFGEQLIAGAVGAGEEVIIQKSIALDELGYNPNDIRLLSIIWKKDGSKYTVVNTNSLSEFQAGVELLATTATRQLGEADFQISVQPNVVSDFSLLKLILPSQRKNFRVELWTLDGRKVQDIFSGQLPAGEHQWSIDRSVTTAAGVYVLRLYDGLGQISRQLIFQ
ncbi:Omp28-related outer membrane protein [Flavilitoribacter nigricans]|uniref:Omp28-related outer membrane protein n=1 Tax=Flavilitoribacter nigricans (strain ATCC 23147 / DSM 23189 / NBRC 102662 / NCIMB 1420 / SS-2) TaxID=1122177 RepID=A0A2D0NBT0_FLAN2|nr:Omp28-related outer membrane protein [Flavilitoribacter nigricans]PHN05820.1 hypothetical protein CRP01_15225 [Flavilitoribacter nigricans DSM 23189 = NBRC 102662]